MSFAPEPVRPRLLIVEDDPMVLELITIQLGLAGYQTFHAVNGKEALSRLAELRPDGMVLDINMPVMDGFAVLRALKTFDAGDRPPTLVLTARHQPDDVKTAIALGARDFISKPFHEDQLLSRVRRLLRKALRPAPGDVAGPQPRELAGT